LTLFHFCWRQPGCLANSNWLVCMMLAKSLLECHSKVSSASNILNATCGTIEFPNALTLSFFHFEMVILSSPAETPSFPR
jgi:hypothetical protein